MTSLKGQFLVASPHLPDPNFYRSVVLMVAHDENGAFGLVLNRPTPSTVREVWELLGAEDCTSELPIHLGGPVAGPITAVHGWKACAENEVLPGVYFASHKDHLDRLVRKQPSKLRVFSGYSGWGAGQLEQELEMGGWMTTPALPGEIFGDSQVLWRDVARRIGLDILGASLPVGELPDDPSMN